MTNQLIAFVIPTESEPVAIIDVPTPSGIGKASAHVGCAGFDRLSTEAQQECLSERDAMMADIRMFAEMLAASDPNVIAWIFDGAPVVPEDAFNPPWPYPRLEDEVLADCDREDYIGC